MTPASKAPVAKSAAKATKTPAKAPAKKVPAKKAPAKAATVKKAPAKAPAKKAATAVKKTPAKAAAKTPAKKVVAPAKKAAAPAKKAAASAKKAPAPVAKATAPEKVVAPAPVKAAVPAKKVPVKPKIGPYAKDTKFLDEQRELLLIEREIYSGQAVDLKAEADALAQEREPGDVQFDEESGEGGTVTVDRERDLAMAAQALAAVEEIDDALERVKSKMYGYCERCFQPIPKPRLRALPYARLCVACKSGGLSRR
jgi:RNA polymerase-binding transcription factor DksA